MKVFCKDCKYYTIGTYQDDEGKHPSNRCINEKNMNKSCTTYDPIDGAHFHDTGEYLLNTPETINRKMNCKWFKSKST